MAEKNRPKLSRRALRLLDANLNRAREGLRVVEDTARFLWNDQELYDRLRFMRHRLQQVTVRNYKKLLAARESGMDVGRRMEEGPRASVKAVVGANMRRAQEAVRVLEEYSKFFSPQAGAVFKEIRYQLYVEEKKLINKL